MGEIVRFENNNKVILFLRKIKKVVKSTQSR